MKAILKATLIPIIEVVSLTDKEKKDYLVRILERAQEKMLVLIYFLTIRRNIIQIDDNLTLLKAKFNFQNNCHNFVLSSIKEKAPSENSYF